MQSIEELKEGSNFDSALHNLKGVSRELQIKIEELQNLNMQDKTNYLGAEEPLLTSKSLTLYQAHKLVQEIKSRQSDELRQDCINLITLTTVKGHRVHLLQAVQLNESTRRSGSSMRKRRIQKTYRQKKE